MRVVHVIPAISQESSGPTYSTIRLCESIAKHASEVRLAAMDFGHSTQPPAFARVFPIGWGPRKLGRSPELCRWLREESQAGCVDLIHNHGMWQMNGIYPAKTAKRFQIPLVASTRGACSKWAMAHGSKFKNIFWQIYQRSALCQANCIHATAMAELHDIRQLGFRQPIAVIPNGIDVSQLEKSAPSSLRTLLFLGRVHPVKGLENLLAAWKHVQDKHPHWQLRIAGSDDGYIKSSGYAAKIRKLAQELCIKRVEFAGELTGEDKKRAFADAELFVLPSHSENFGIAVAEALAAGTPAIVSKGAPWEGLIANVAGWHIDIGEEPLARCLDKALACSQTQLQTMGMAGRSWMLREFSWESVGLKMFETYRWLCGQSESAPSCVFFDKLKV